MVAAAEGEEPANNINTASGFGMQTDGNDNQAGTAVLQAGSQPGYGRGKSSRKNFNR